MYLSSATSFALGEVLGFRPGLRLLQTKPWKRALGIQGREARHTEPVAVTSRPPPWLLWTGQEWQIYHELLIDSWPRGRRHTFFLFEDEMSKTLAAVSSCPFAVSPKTLTAVSSCPFAVSPKTLTAVSSCPFAVSPKTLTAVSSCPYVKSPRLPLQSPAVLSQCHQRR